MQRTPDTPPGALGRAPEGTVVLDPATGGRMPTSPLRPRAVAQRRGSDRRARVEGWRRRLRGVLATTARPRQPSSRRAGTGPATWPTETRPVSSISPAGTTTGSASTRSQQRRPPRSSGFCSGTPTSCWPRSTPCPTRPSDDQVMAAVQLRPGLNVLDAAALPASSSPRQGDLGTKWAPRFVRMSAELPATATNKVLKRSLRAERWNCADPVLWQAEKGGAYRRLHAERRRCARGRPSATARSESRRRRRHRRRLGSAVVAEDQPAGRDAGPGGDDGRARRHGHLVDRMPLPA